MLAQELNMFAALVVVGERATHYADEFLLMLLFPTCAEARHPNPGGGRVYVAEYRPCGQKTGGYSPRIGGKETNGVAESISRTSLLLLV